MKLITRALLAVLALLPAVGAAQTAERVLPSWGIKTNLLYDATSTINLGVEFRLGGHTSLDLPFNLNPWEFGENRKWKHMLAQPEFRYWLKETFRGHFFGVHAFGGIYNIGNVPNPPFTLYMQQNRFEGWLAGAGLSYGYRYNFRNPNWALEATIGGGYAYLDYSRFECAKCGDKLEEKAKHYMGPTKVGLSLIKGFGGQRGAKAPRSVVAIPEPPKASVYEPRLMASFITPEVETVKLRRQSGQAYLDYKTGRAEIVPDFSNNAEELRRIYRTIDEVMDHPDRTISSIVITGYASPEGSAQSNQALSARRADALRDHIARSYDLPPSVFTTRGAGEDWAGLDSLTRDMPMMEKSRIQEIIRGGGDPDARERALMGVAVGIPYRQLRASVYPRLRRSDYTIEYTVASFTVDQGMEVLETRPESLSLNEMFLIANTYEPGSEAFNDVFETAAREYPDSDVANLNAAASALESRDAADAAHYLARVREHGAEYWNNMGMLQWIQGDKQAAAASFAQAGRLGADNAAELGRHLESLK